MKNNIDILTKREYFTGMALQGLLASNVCLPEMYDTSDEWRNEIVEAAVEFADASIRALEVIPEGYVLQTGEKMVQRQKACHYE